MGKNTYSIFLETKKGLISIPCGNLKDIDSYTKRFKNREEFLKVIIKMLNLPLKISDVGIICLSTQYKKNYEFDYERCLPILYNDDDYNIQSLIEYFGDYLKKSRSRLQMFDEYVSKVIPFYDDGTYTDSDIVFFAKVFLKDNYSNHRGVYFLLKDDCKIIKNKFVSRANENENEKENGMENSYDDASRYLIQLSSEKGELFEKTFDELSKMDLEELSALIGKKFRGFVDGLSDLSLPNRKDIEGIQNITGCTLEELQHKCSLQLSKRRKR